uniref:C3H1-type domain-containing protein n=1 Tax=Noctiluca scintillans TaxID=2966 RepID=A0A7S1FGW9_NOCSC
MCPKCEYHNFSRNDTCGKCSAEKPDDISSCRPREGGGVMERCYDYSVGKCFRGDACRFAHLDDRGRDARFENSKRDRSRSRRRPRKGRDDRDNRDRGERDRRRDRSSNRRRERSRDRRGERRDRDRRQVRERRPRRAPSPSEYSEYSEYSDYSKSEPPKRRDRPHKCRR